MCAANEWDALNTPEEPDDPARLDGYARSFAERCRAGERTPYVSVCEPVTVVYFHSDDDDETVKKFQRQWTARLQPEPGSEGVSTFYDAGADNTDQILQAFESFHRRYAAANPLLRLFVVLDPGCKWETILGGVEGAARAIQDGERIADILLCMRVSPEQTGSGQCLKTAVQLKAELEKDQQKVHLYCFAFGRGIKDPNGNRKTSELKAILDTAMLICADKSKLRGAAIEAYSDSTTAKLQVVGSLRVDAQLEAAYKVAFDAFSDACIDRFWQGEPSAWQMLEADDATPLAEFLAEAKDACSDYVDRLAGYVRYLTHQPYAETMITQDKQTTNAFDRYYYDGLLESYFSVNLAQSGIPEPEARLTQEALTAYLYRWVDRVELKETMDWIRAEMQNINKTYPIERAADGFKPEEPEKTALQYYAAQHMVDVQQQAIDRYLKLLRDCLDMFQTIEQKLKETKVTTQNSKTGMTHFVYYTTLENQIEAYFKTNPYKTGDIRARLCGENTSQSYLEIIHGLFEEDPTVQRMIPTDISFLKDNNEENIESIQEKIKQKLERHRRVRIQQFNPDDIATTYAITNDPDSFIKLFDKMQIRCGARAGITEPYLTLVKIWEIEDPKNIILD